MRVWNRRTDCVAPQASLVISLAEQFWRARTTWSSAGGFVLTLRAATFAGHVKDGVPVYVAWQEAKWPHPSSLIWAGAVSRSTRGAHRAVRSRRGGRGRRAPCLGGAPAAACGVTVLVCCAERVAPVSAPSRSASRAAAAHTRPTKAIGGRLPRVWRRPTGGSLGRTHTGRIARATLLPPALIRQSPHTHACRCVYRALREGTMKGAQGRIAAGGLAPLYIQQTTPPRGGGRLSSSEQHTAAQTEQPHNTRAARAARNNKKEHTEQQLPVFVYPSTSSQTTACISRLPPDLRSSSKI